jgi:malate dehydrogenase (oxaloacetate-decarboxylating)
MNPLQLKKKSLALHKAARGKIEISAKTPLRDMRDLALVYTPGVGAVSSAIAKNPALANTLTWKRNTVAVVSDGSAVLGLGNIGPLAALPVMEGKSAIFKRFADIDAIPIVLSTQDPDEIVKTVIAIAPTFGAIQLEDISAPRCFDIEERLHHLLDIPVMHDDQHGTAVVVLAGLLNAVKVVKKELTSLRIVIAGAGAAGTAIAQLLYHQGVRQIISVDRGGAIFAGRKDLNSEKKKLAAITNPRKQPGPLANVMHGADVFIGTSGPGIATAAMVRSMAPKSIVFALANPIPEIMPNVAKQAGARVIATGRSDFPNQINNALCYPGLFRGMLDRGVTKITHKIKLSAAHAIASRIKHPTPERIIPSLFDKGLHAAVVQSVKK